MIFRKGLWMAPIALGLAGCASRIPGQLVTQRQFTAVQTVMRQQVENAVEAGLGDPDARRLRAQLSANPGNLEARMKLASYYRRQGFHELAAEHYRLALERFPENPDAVLHLAQTLHEQRLTKEAAEILAQFLAKNQPQKAELPAWLGILRDELGDFAQAESAHRAALALSPGNAKFHNNLGYNLLLQGKRQEAIQEFRRALDIDPRLETARNNLGMALLQEGGPGSLEQGLEQMQAVSDAATAHNNAAVVLMQQGRYVEARRELEQALRLRPAHAPALKNLAILSRMEGQAPLFELQHSAAAAKPGHHGILHRLWNIIAGVESHPNRLFAPANGQD